VTSDEPKGNPRGFSLLEMMTVISLILILATFSMPIYRTLVVRAREATLRDDLFTLRSQIDRFTHDHERGPETLQELVEKEYMGNVPNDPFTGSNETWEVETETDPLSVDASAPLGIADVHSGSQDVSLEGTPYSSW
jgi:general secretion pathway protein G